MMSLKVVLVALVAVCGQRSAADYPPRTDILDKIEFTLAGVRNNIQKMDEQLESVISSTRSGVEETAKAQGVIWIDNFHKTLRDAESTGTNVSQCEGYINDIESLARRIKPSFQQCVDKENLAVQTVRKEVLDDLRNQTIEILKRTKTLSEKCSDETCRLKLLSTQFVQATVLGTRTANTSLLINAISSKYNANIWGCVENETYDKNNDVTEVMGIISRVCSIEKESK